MTGEARRLGRWLCVGIVVMAVLHLVLHSAHDWFDALPGNTGRWFDLNSENSIATWFNFSLLLLVAAAAAVAAVSAASRAARWAWGALSAAVALLSLDEQVSIHERLPDLIGLEKGTMATHEWLIPGAILGLLGVAVLGFLARVLPRLVRRGLLRALAIYAAGALAVEALSGLAIRSLPLEHPLRRAVPLWEILEESLEMLGCIVALMTVVSHLYRTGALVTAAPVTPSRVAQPE